MLCEHKLRALCEHERCIYIDCDCVHAWHVESMYANPGVRGTRFIRISLSHDSTRRIYFPAFSYLLYTTLICTCICVYRWCVLIDGAPWTKCGGIVDYISTLHIRGNASSIVADFSRLLAGLLLLAETSPCVCLRVVCVRACVRV